jgi:hypothetical protein
MSPDTEELDTTADHDPTAGDGSPGGGATVTARRLDGRNRLPGWVPGAVIALAFVMVAGLGLWQWRYDSDLAGERDQRKSAIGVATSFAEKLLTYDYKDLAAARDSVTALITESYKTTYDQAFTIGLEPQITKLQATSVAHVQAVYLTEITSGDASAIVVVDADTTSTAGVRTLKGTYLKLDLVKDKGHFLVNAVTAVSTASESLTPPGADTTTTTATTAPAEPTTASGG